jgi:diguanylate cyclase (GGDEF)-like protein
VISRLRWSGDDGSLVGPEPEKATLADLAHPVPVLPGTASCEELDRTFGRSHAAGCAVITHPDVDGVVGLVERSRFEATMSGPFGYGRSLYARRPLADIAQWDALALPATTPVVAASSRAITRAAAHVADHVIVCGPGGVQAVSMPGLLAAVAQALAGQALRDPLTGLANRTAFFGRVEESCRRTATQPGHQTAVVYLDLDGFKAVNDELGHDTGDRLLRDVAATLAGAARPSDLVARLGGDEFAICLDVETSPRDGAGQVGESLVRAVASRLHGAIAAMQQAGGPASSVRVSIGVAACAGGGIDPEELVRAADLAMYTSKRNGGDQITGPVVVTSSGLADPLVGTSISEAARRGELTLVYQPIVGLADGQVCGVEALVRWRHPRLGLLSPDAFLYSAARAGQLVELDDWVLRTAIGEFAAWRDTHPSGSPARAVSLNVNVSTDRLLTPGLCGVMLAAARSAGLLPEMVRVEVPEQLLVAQLHAAARPLTELRQAGFLVAFDDVGAGGTSLRHLREVSADGLKIDRSFVHGMLADDRDRALVQLLIDFATSTGLGVCAEGVETEAQREALAAMGCRFAQGWLFARPGPIDQVDLSYAAVRVPVGASH